MHKDILNRALDYWWVVAIGVTAVWLIALTVYVQALGKPVGDIPVIGGDTYKVVAATGSEGFDVEGFCNDPLTIVTPASAPDVERLIYTLQRTRDGVMESVLVIEGQSFARHYYDTPEGQQSQSAIVTEKALSCIRRKA